MILPCPVTSIINSSTIFEFSGLTWNKTCLLVYQIDSSHVFGYNPLSLFVYVSVIFMPFLLPFYELNAMYLSTRDLSKRKFLEEANPFPMMCPEELTL